MSKRSPEKFVMFNLCATMVALRAEVVRFWIEWELPITTIENMPPYVLGRTMLCAEKEVFVQDLRRRFLPYVARPPTSKLTLLVCLPDQTLTGFMVDGDWARVIGIEKPKLYEHFPNNSPLDPFIKNNIVWRDRATTGGSNKCLWLLDPQKLAQIV